MNKQNLHGLFFVPPIDQNFIGHIAAEIWKDQIYFPYLNGRKDLTIIDAGFNVGIFSYYASQFAKKIYAIEPSKEHVEVGKYMLDFNKITNVETFQFALSIKDDEGVLTHYSNKTMYSLYPNVTGTITNTGGEKVKLKKIDTFFKEQNIEHVDFLKLDVEGVEFEILGSESFKNVSPKIDCLVVEVHNYSNRNPSQIIQSLQLNGYQVQQIQNDAILFVAKR